MVIISSTTFADDARNKRDIVWDKHTEGILGLMPCLWLFTFFLNIEFLLPISSIDLLTEKRSVYIRLFAQGCTAFVGKLRNS